MRHHGALEAWRIKIDFPRQTDKNVPIVDFAGPRYELPNAMNTSSTLGLSIPSLLRFAVVVMLIGAPRVALADLPRPAGWEPTCTIEKEQKKGGVSCEQCRGWQDPDPCQKALEAKGLTRRCTEGGAGSFVAVWCKGTGSTPNASDTPPASTTSAPATTATTTASAATNSPMTPPPVAPATDNRRGGGMCAVGVIGQDKRGASFWTLVPLGIGLGLLRRRVSLRKNRLTNRVTRKNALP